MQLPLPETLFRYRAINSHAQDIVENCRLFFSKVEQLGDPLDCRIGYDFAATPELFEKTICDHARRHGIPNSFIKDQVRRYKSKSPTQRQNMAKRLADNWIENVQQKIRVCCFCEDGLSQKMFDTYADGHRGICLEFSNTLVSDIQFLLPVKYRPTLTRHNFFETYLSHRRGEVDFLETAFTLKKDVYAFEKEWRVFTHDEGEYVSFAPNSLLGITFGCQCSKKSIDEVLSWGKPGKPLLYWKAKFAGTNFELIREPFEI